MQFGEKALHDTAVTMEMYCRESHLDKAKEILSELKSAREEA